MRTEILPMILFMPKKLLNLFLTELKKILRKKRAGPMNISADSRLPLILKRKEVSLRMMWKF